MPTFTSSFKTTIKMYVIIMQTTQTLSTETINLCNKSLFLNISSSQSTITCYQFEADLISQLYYRFDAIASTLSL
jgi:hypothetical protein